MVGYRAGGHFYLGKNLFPLKLLAVTGYLKKTLLFNTFYTKVKTEMNLTANSTIHMPLFLSTSSFSHIFSLLAALSNCCMSFSVYWVMITVLATV